MVVIRPKAIGQAQWDHFNYNSLAPNLYCTWHHLEAITAGWGRQGWEIWAGPTSNPKEWQWAMPVPLKYGGWVKGIVQPLFTQQLGVLFSPTFALDHQIEILKLVLTGLGRETIYSLNHQNWKILSNAGLISDQPGALFMGESAPNYCLDLGNGYDSIESKYSQNLRRKLKKGFYPTITYYKGSNWEKVVDLFNAYININYTIISQRQLDKLRNICQAWAKNDQLITTLAYNEVGELLAGLLYLTFPEGTNPQRYIAFMGGATTLGKSDGSQMKLMDHNIKTFSERGIGVYDFEGSRIPSIKQVFQTFSPDLMSYFVANKQVQITNSPH